LLANDGSGVFTLVAGATPNDTPATLGLAVADFDGDGRLDVLQGQGEIQQSLADRVQLATPMIAVDAASPVVRVASSLDGDVLTARVTDHIGPSHVHDFQKVVVVVGQMEIPMTWYGEMLWRATVPAGAIAATYQVCATDRQGNQGCATNAPAGGDAGVGDAGIEATGSGGGCCDTGGDQRGAWWLAIAVALTWLRPRPRGRRRICRAVAAAPCARSR
jgi:hypothetical protein